MVRAAQRAQRNTTGYYTGYIQKRQPEAKFELRQAAQNLRYLAKSIRGKSNRSQYHQIANRMLGELEYRGHARPATEEFNPAANHDDNDVTKAEFLRTFDQSAFHGGELLRRHEQMASAADSSSATRDEDDAVPIRVPAPHPDRGPKAKHQVAFCDDYGYRGQSNLVYYLSPWEFCKWWTWKKLFEPTYYETRREPCLTRWTEKGL